MVGQGGLADVQRIQQFAGTFLPVVEQLQDLDPVFIAQSLEYIGHLPVRVFHGSTPLFSYPYRSRYIDICQYIALPKSATLSAS